METIAPGRQSITKVVLDPQIEWTGMVPDDQKLDAMHHEAHAMCFIANSVKTEVSVAKALSQP
jgi:organic hydroperoxide reductase OsmC/OhrA